MRRAAAISIVLGLALPARAQEPAVALTSRTSYRAYQIRLAPGDDAMRHLNRFASSLDGRLWGLGPGIDVVMSLRYDTDFGTGFHRDTPAGLGIPVTDERDDLDLQYLYAEWRGIWDGRIDLRVGRQLILDDLDWYSLDGARLVLRPFARAPGYALELYVGRAVGFDAVLSSEPFVPDGIEVDDGSVLAVGGALSGRAFDDLAFSLAYRGEMRFRSDTIEVYGRDPAGTTGGAVAAGSAGKIGLQGSRLGGSLSYTIRPADLEVYAHAVWSFLFAEIDEARAGLAYNPKPGLHVAVEGLRVRPRFAGDSIFNVFNIFPYDRGRAELSWEIVPGLSLWGGYFLQHFEGSALGPKSDETAGDADPAVRGGEGLEFGGSSRMHGPSGGIQYRGETWGLGAFAEASTNFSGYIAYGGTYRRAELFGDVGFLEGRLQGELRLGYHGQQNDWFEGADLGDVQPEQQSYSIDASVRGEPVSGVILRGRFIKRFDSALAGDYYASTELEVRY